MSSFARRELEMYQDAESCSSRPEPVKPVQFDNELGAVAWECPCCGFRQRSLVEDGNPFGNHHGATCVMCEAEFECWERILSAEEYLRVQGWILLKRHSGEKFAKPFDQEIYRKTEGTGTR